MSEVKKHIIQARHFEFGRVHHYRDAEALYGKDSASDDCAVALGRLCIEKIEFSLVKRRTETLARLRRAAATSEPSFRRKLAIYLAYLNGGWNTESINLLHLASQKGDYQAGYIMSCLVKQSGDAVMKHLSLPIAGRDALYRECLQRSARFGCFEASCALGCYYWDLGQVEEPLRMLAQAAESGCFEALLLKRRCRSIGSGAYCVDMEAFLSHAKRLACDMNDIVTAGCLADYLADVERGASVDRVAALRFHRKSFRWEPSEHAYFIFGDRRWDWRGRFFRRWLRFIRDDYLRSSEHSHFPIARSPNGRQVN